MKAFNQKYNKDDVFEAEDIVYFLCKSADVEEITLEFSNKKTSKNKICFFKKKL